MKIVFLDLAGPDFPGGCEKYFSILSNYFSAQNEVYFLQSKQYVGLMEHFYHILSGHKVGTIDYIKRDIGKSTRINLSFSVLLPFSRKNGEIKSILNSSDVIYSKNEFQELLLLYYLLGRKKFSKKVVIGVHSAIFVPKSVKGVWKFVHELQYNSYFYKKFLNSAKSIHTINRDDEFRINEYYGVNKSKIKYIPYFIDWKISSPKKVANKKFIILWAGRLTQQKGLDRLTDIISELSKNKIFNNLEFWIAGGGEEIELITKLVKKYKNVRYLGYVNNLTNLYPKIDLSIVTSYFETFGYNVLEPQSFGIPVISFNIEGPRDIIKNTVTGNLVNSKEEFIKSIIVIYKHKKNFNKKKISELMRIKFSKQKLLLDLEKIIFK